jgi:hypothetical protein
MVKVIIQMTLLATYFMIAYEYMTNRITESHHPRCVIPFRTA